MRVLEGIGVSAIDDLGADPARKTPVINVWNAQKLPASALVSFMTNRSDKLTELYELTSAYTRQWLTTTSYVPSMDLNAWGFPGERFYIKVTGRADDSKRVGFFQIPVYKPGEVIPEANVYIADPAAGEKVSATGVVTPVVPGTIVEEPGKPPVVTPQEPAKKNGDAVDPDKASKIGWGIAALIAVGAVAYFLMPRK